MTVSAPLIAEREVDVATDRAPFDAKRVAQLNAEYAPLDFNARIERLYRDFDPDKVLVTSSFAATSAYFLHIISTIRRQQPIAFIDTGYHFPKTLEYRDYLVERFGLTAVSYTHLTLPTIYSV